MSKNQLNARVIKESEARRESALIINKIYAQCVYLN